MSAPLKIGVLAGEPSGDRLGAALMNAIRAEAGRPVSFVGVGGVAMEEAGAPEGFKSLFPIADIAVMGFVEVAMRLPSILRRLKEAEDALAEAKPDAVITIDAPSFGLRVAKKLKARMAPPPVLIHYVAPSVWAWRPKRAAEMARYVDHLLALLPFEPPYFERVGLSCAFVGHPVVERARRLDPNDRNLRDELGVYADAPVVVALVGSRPSEIERLAGPFGVALELLAKKREGLQVIAPLAENVADLARERLSAWPVRPHFLDPREFKFDVAENRKFRAYAAADAGLAASGTVSLELASMRTPMVIAYRVNAISAEIARRLITIDTATLVNLVSETRAVPEFLQERCRPELMAEALDALLRPDSAARKAQAKAAEVAMARLGEGEATPSTRAARSALEAIERGPVPR